MKLVELTLARYRQFIDQRLLIDPNVTTIVGRNDTGKTGLLSHFFDQSVYEGVIAGGDRPLVPGYQGASTAFSMVWHITADDFDSIQFPEEFGTRGAKNLEILFQDQAGPVKHWNYRLDGTPIEAYEGPDERGAPSRKKSFRLRKILPTPLYLGPLRRLVEPHFQMQAYDSPGVVESERERLSFEHRRLSPESILLRVAGVLAFTRNRLESSEPWNGSMRTPPSASQQDLEQKLHQLAERITEKLQTFWRDPSGLIFDIRIVAAGAATYSIIWNVRDGAGLTYHGTGLMWFVSFIVDWLFIEEFPGPLLLLLDEPAGPLHPSAQRVVAKILSSLSSRHQLIYGTHSPFMIDWNFPQRIRLFTRDHDSKRAHIDNKPYAPRLGMPQSVWDPLREAIGVTVGDIVVLGERNILVEGVTEQILLANASAFFETLNKPHIDLAATSIIPYSDSTALKYVIAKARSRQTHAIVLGDSDDHGRSVEHLCTREGVSYLAVGTFSDRTDGDRSIEDVIGTVDYVSAVNEFYRTFDWFVPINVDQVHSEIGNRSLGKYLKDLFAERFERSLDKIGVAIYIAQGMSNLAPDALARLQALVDQLCRSAAAV